MIKLVRGRLQGKFARSVLVLMSGTVLAQIISLLAMPVITRLYGPEAFGVLGAFTSIITIAAPLVVMNYPLAIMLPKTNADARVILLLCLWLSLFLSFIVYLFIELMMRASAEFGGAAREYLYFVPVATFLSGFTVVSGQWLLRSREFSLKAKLSVMQAFSMSFIKIVLGCIVATPMTLVAVFSLSPLVYVSYLYGVKKYSRGYNCRYLYLRASSVKFGAIKDAAFKYRELPLYRTPQALLNGFGQSMPVMFLFFVYDARIAGFYSLAKMVLIVPSNLVGNAFTDVFYPKFTTLKREGKCGKPLLLKTVGLLITFSLLPYGFVILLGPWVFGFVFGEEWMEAGEIAVWLSLWMMAVFATRPVVAAISTLRLQKAFLVIELFATCFRMLGLILAFYIFSSHVEVIAVFSLINIIFYLVTTSYVYARS